MVELSLNCGTNMNAPEHICPSISRPGEYLHHRPESDPFDDGHTERTLTAHEAAEILGYEP